MSTCDHCAKAVAEVTAMLRSYEDRYEQAEASIERSRRLGVTSTEGQQVELQRAIGALEAVREVAERLGVDRR